MNKDSFPLLTVRLLLPLFKKNTFNVIVNDCRQTLFSRLSHPHPRNAYIDLVIAQGAASIIWMWFISMCGETGAMAWHKLQMTLPGMGFPEISRVPSSGSACDYSDQYEHLWG